MCRRRPHAERGLAHASGSVAWSALRPRARHPQRRARPVRKSAGGSRVHRIAPALRAPARPQCDGSQIATDFDYLPQLRRPAARGPRLALAPGGAMQETRTRSGQQAASSGRREVASASSSPTYDLIAAWDEEPHPAGTVALCNWLAGVGAPPWPEPFVDRALVMELGRKAARAHASRPRVLLALGRMFLAWRELSAALDHAGAGGTLRRASATFRLLGEVLFRRGDVAARRACSTGPSPPRDRRRTRPGPPPRTRTSPTPRARRRPRRPRPGARCRPRPPSRASPRARRQPALRRNR